MYGILKPNLRGHADYFSWETDRPAAELGVLEVFERELRADGQEFFTKARHRGPRNDPPDCEAISLTGQRIGIEITELVDPDSAEKARAGKRYAARNWNDDLIPELDAIIRRKDAPSNLKGGPYSEYVLLIHTDEALEFAYVQLILADHVFPQTRLTTRVYLVTSYDPWDKRCHCLRLNIDRR
jgi:hypothetical protein